MGDSREINIDHFNNLIAVAFADGTLDDEEVGFLYEKADEYEIPRDAVKRALENAEALEFKIPMDEDDREDLLTDIVYMAMIDGSIHEKEYALCLSIAKRLDFDEEDLDHTIELIKKLWDKA